MGIFAWLDKQFASVPVELPLPSKPAPPMPKVKPAKPSGISEPVISLIESLGRDEWELSKYNGNSAYERSHLIINAFHEHICVHIYKKSTRPLWDQDSKDKVLGAEWMTSEEQEAVVRAAIERIEWLEDLNTRRQFDIQRNKFMILAPSTKKETNEQT